MKENTIYTIGALILSVLLMVFYGFLSIISFKSFVIMVSTTKDISITDIVIWSGMISAIVLFFMYLSFQILKLIKSLND